MTPVHPPAMPLSNDDEIDLRQLGAALVRRKAWILAGAGLGILAAVGLNAVSQPTWQGEFQIVLAEKQNVAAGGLAALAASNPLLAGLAGAAGRGGGDLGTEVKILESPSVLRPIFDQVKSRKTSQGINTNALTFKDWLKDSLKVELEKGTSVLTITYQDTDQAAILPVLSKISAAYQAYSGRDRSESLRNGLAYAEAQAQRFRQRSEASNRALDAFRIRYGIAPSGGSVGAARVDLSKLLNTSNNSPSGLSAVNVQGGGSSHLQSQGNPLAQLAAVNQELIRRRQQFTERDPGIQALLRERDALRSYINTTAGGALGLPGQQTPNKAQAQELLLRYQELERTAKRDTATLDSLESSLLSLQLERARFTKPWELISKPTLLEKPVAPRPARNVALGLLAGLVVGSGAALLADRRSGVVFAEEELSTLLPYPRLAQLPHHPEAWLETLQLLIDGPLHGASTIALIPAGQLENQAKAVQQQLQTALQSLAQVQVCHNLHTAASCDAQLLLVKAGHASRGELEQLHQNLQLQGKPVAGVLWL